MSARSLQTIIPLAVWEETEFETATNLVVRKDGFAGSWSVWLDGKRISPYMGLSRGKVEAFLDGLSEGVQAADRLPDEGLWVYVENDHTLWRVATRFIKTFVTATIEWAVPIGLLLVALYGLLNVFEIIRIAAVDWDGSHFLEHIAVLIACVSIVGLFRYRHRLTARLRRFGGRATPEQNA